MFAQIKGQTTVRLYTRMAPVIIGSIELPYRSRSGSLAAGCSAHGKLFRRVHRTKSGGRKVSLSQFSKGPAATW